MKTLLFAFVVVYLLLFTIMIIDETVHTRIVYNNYRIKYYGPTKEINLDTYRTGYDYNNDGKLDDIRVSIGTRFGCTSFSSIKPNRNDQELYLAVQKLGKKVHTFWDVWKDC